jgi:hypothetical protein
MLAPDIFHLSMIQIWGRLSGYGDGESRALQAITPWVIIRHGHLPTHPRSAAMSSDSGDIVQQMAQDFQTLVTDMTGVDAQAQHAYTADLPLCMVARGKPVIRPECGMRRAPREYEGEPLDVT